MITHISNAAGGGSVYNGYQFSVTTKPFSNIQWFLHNIVIEPSWVSVNFILFDIWSYDPGKLYGDHHIKFDQNSLVVHNDEMRESLTQMRPTDFNKTLF